MNENQDKKTDFFDRRPFGIPRRCIFGVAWFLATIATWFVTHDACKVMMVAIGSPFIVGFAIFFLIQIGMIGTMIFVSINEVINSIIPEKCHWIKWYILIPLWVALPLYNFIVRGVVQNSLILFVALPILVFMLLWFISLFGSWIAAACEVRNPIFKVLAIMGVLLFIGFMIAIGVTSKNSVSDDYDQYNRGDSTYFRRR